MSHALERALFWIPRALLMIFAAFLSLFALDVFAATDGLLPTVGALLLHLIPTALVLILLGIAWRRERTGGLLLLALAAFYIITTQGRFPAATYLAIAGPLAVCGLMFLAHSLRQTGH